MKNTILFDLDGTLLNTLYDIAAAVNYTLNKLNCPERSIEEVRKFVGNGADMLIKRALPEDYKYDWKTALEIHRKYYNANLCNKTIPYDGINELLDGIRSKGYKLGVVTNKPDEAAHNIIEHYFNDKIDAVVGANTTKRRKKPEPDGVDYCLELLNSKRENAIYVGDSDVDVATAKNAGLTGIGVTWGFREKEFLEGADFIVDNCQELYDVIVNS